MCKTLLKMDIYHVKLVHLLLPSTVSCSDHVLHVLTEPGGWKSSRLRSGNQGVKDSCSCSTDERNCDITKIGECCNNLWHLLNLIQVVRYMQENLLAKIFHIRFRSIFPMHTRCKHFWVSAPSIWRCLYIYIYMHCNLCIYIYNFLQLSRYVCRNPSHYLAQIVWSFANKPILPISLTNCSRQFYRWPSQIARIDIVGVT